MQHQHLDVEVILLYSLPRQYVRAKVEHTEEVPGLHELPDSQEKTKETGEAEV